MSRPVRKAPREPHVEVRPGPEGPRIYICAFYGPARRLEVTDVLVEALARQLWRLHGGNETANRVEAALLLEQLVGSRQGLPSGEPERQGKGREAGTGKD